MFPVDLQLKIQPFGPESAFFRDAPPGARSGASQLSARRSRYMRRQGQHSPSASVFCGAEMFFNVPGKRAPLARLVARAASLSLRRLPSVMPLESSLSASRPVRTPRQLPQHRFGSARAAPACSPSAKRTAAAGGCTDAESFVRRAESFAHLFGAFCRGCCGAVDN